MTHQFNLKQIKHDSYRLKYCFKLLSVMTICLMSAPILYAGNALHAHKEIQSVAVEFVRVQLPTDITVKSLKAGKIDSRLRFKQCSQPLETRSTMNKSIARNWTISIRCNDEAGWSLYLPVKAELTRKMLVSKTTITRGEIITADKVKLIDQTISQQNQKHFSKLADAIGRQARRTIQPDRVLNSTMLQQAYLVRKRETVMIYAQNSKLRISMQGTALKNGKQNEMIPIRNNSSKKIIEALVVDRGVVAINF